MVVQSCIMGSLHTMRMIGMINMINLFIEGNGSPPTRRTRSTDIEASFTVAFNTGPFNAPEYINFFLFSQVC